MSTKTSFDITQRAIPDDGPLRLVVVGKHAFRVVALPAKGVLVVGRADDADIMIEDSTVSRRHCEIEVAQYIAIRDLGSANQTRIRGRALQSGETVRVQVGDPIEIGSITVLLQRGPEEVVDSPFCSYDYFDLMLAQACSRRAKNREPFAVLRLSISHDATDNEQDLLQKILMECSPSHPLVAQYGPRDYVAFFGDERAIKFERAWEGDGRISGLTGVEVRWAHFPRDGRTPHELVEHLRTPRENPPAARHDVAVIEDQKSKAIYELVERVAVGDISVLILGETGVGKELVARRVHQRSRRCDHPFVGFNCAALSETLLESELFGHEKGAFTGATSTKKGLLEAAAGGSIFLDEIGEMSPATQAKLLRVLEERCLRRVGGLKSVPIDVRLIAATNRDLEMEVAKESFRKDLYFRLNGVTIVVPPLRERTVEIGALAHLFVAQSSASLGHQRPPTIDGTALALLQAYSWPGNVRELRNVMERAVLLCDDVIEAKHLPVESMTRESNVIVATKPTDAAFAQEVATTEQDSTLPEGVTFSVADLDERRRIVEALRATGGNQKLAADELQMSRRTLSRRLDVLRIPRPRKG